MWYFYLSTFLSIYLYFYFSKFCGENEIFDMDQLLRLENYDYSLSPPAH